MSQIIAFFGCFGTCLTPTTLRQLSGIVVALLTMTGRVTMLGISRWGQEGTSYRTVQRFFSTAQPWCQIFWLFFVHHLLRSDEVYLLCADETVTTKAGKHTYGLDRFFSSIYNKPVRGLSFLGLSLVGVKQGISHPLLVEQVVRDETEKQAAKAKAAKAKAAKAKAAKTKTAKTKTAKAKAAKAKAATSPQGVGRPKGSKNKDKAAIEWTSELRRLERMVTKLLALIDGLFPVTYLLLDGHFGNNNVLQVVRQELKLHLISKLRSDSALFFAYQGPQKSSGRPRRYGDKLDYRAIPEAYRVADTQEKGIRTEIYQATLLHTNFAQPLNVVILVKTNLQSGARGHAVLFSSDMELGWEPLMHYYRLRFQIEFNFRDAKQFWGLEDFMNTGQTQVTNAANLAFFMVNLSQRLLQEARQVHPQAGVLDIKAHWRGRHYAQETLKLLPQQPAPDLREQIMQKVACYGAIHTQPTPAPAI
jgi:putative transposase